MTAAAARPEVHVLQLYPRDMNIYGDNGNALVLTRRLERYGYTPVLHAYNPEDEFPEVIDIVVGGGGQDSGQGKIESDLQRIAPRLRELADDGVPMLVICGLYQLFGKHFDTAAGVRIPGIGILDVETVGTEQRLIGNVVARSDEFGEILGYENHSGQTVLGPQATPFATVEMGEGNNADDHHEGARYKNVIGSYLHGALLPKNPAVADFLIRTAVERRYGKFTDEQLDDTLAQRAREQARLRPR